jgi:lysophospholipase L1-like esterase
MGCIGHPNSQGQQAIAEAIYPEVKKLLTARHEASND